ncbi:MAG: DUF1080 domain-containing protein [Planctomycetes bacterium]|nr:DUF1080 domain-containing protein [Planctomycetota bacterium]
MSKKIFLLLSVCFILASANLWADSCCSAGKKGADQLDPDNFIKMFDGKTLNGWEVLPGGKWKVENGAIVGSQDKSERRHGMLLSRKTYTDFIVKLKYKSLKGNSGFYFRAKRVKSGVSVNGFQAEIDSGGADVGGIYETAGRYWVSRVSPEKVDTFYKKHDWNEMVIRAVGKDTTVYVNGVKTVELVNDPGRTKGHFGLQLHGGQDMHVEFKDIEIMDLSDDMDYTALKESGFTQMFNGKDLTGWQTTGNWMIEEGNILTLKPRPGERGWQRYGDYIATKRKYGNFVLKLDFKFNKRGNSGVFMRIGDLKNHVTSGFELQILDTHGKKKPGQHDGGGIISTSGPSKNMMKPAGEWNEYIVYLNGNRLKVTLNGEQIQDLDISKTGLKNRPAMGHISFQDEAKNIWYRNVRIRELDSEPAERTKGQELFKADLSNAIYPAGVWTFKDGILTASKDKCIWTEKEYEDFVLDVDFKTEAGTNSGVIVRNTDMKKWIPGAIEIQIADDYAKKWKNSPATWHCGAIFGHLAPTKSAVKKPGQWNRMQITCKGKIITVVLNDEKVSEMDMDLWTSAKKNPDGSDIPRWLSKPVAGLPLKGRIGLQGTLQRAVDSALATILGREAGIRNGMLTMDELIRENKKYEFDTKGLKA